MGVQWYIALVGCVLKGVEGGMSVYIYIYLVAHNSVLEWDMWLIASCLRAVFNTRIDLA